VPAKIKLLGFVDADFAGEITTQKSQSGYLFLLCGGPIIWVSNRQAVYTVSQKNDSDVAHYNFNTHQPILVIFGNGVCYQMAIRYPTSPN